jgi:hypothetical protein
MMVCEGVKAWHAHQAYDQVLLPNMCCFVFRIDLYFLLFERLAQRDLHVGASRSEMERCRRL